MFRQQFVTDRMATRFDAIIDATTDARLRSLLRQFGCGQLQLPPCVDRLRPDFDLLLQTTGNLSVNTRSVRDLRDTETVLCVGLRLPDVRPLVRNAIGRHATDPAFDRMLVRALGCGARRPFVALLVNRTLRAYWPDVYASAAGDPVGRMFVLEHLFDDGATEAEEAALRPPVAAFLRRLSSELEFAVLQLLFERASGRSAADRRVWTEIVRSIRATLAWKRRVAGALDRLADG